jgi:hypothetical protein
MNPMERSEKSKEKIHPKFKEKKAILNPVTGEVFASNKTYNTFEYWSENSNKNRKAHNPTQINLQAQIINPITGQPILTVNLHP